MELIDALAQTFDHTAEVVGGIEPAPMDADVGAQLRAEAGRTLAAWRAHGLDGEVTIAAGPMPARLAATINLVDTTTHAWDLAQATKQAVRIPDELAAGVLAVAKGFIDDDVRSRGGFRAPVRARGPVACRWWADASRSWWRSS